MPPNFKSRQSPATLRAALRPTSAPERRRFKAQIDRIVERHVGDAFNEMFTVATKRRCRSTLDIAGWFVDALEDHAQRYAHAIPRRKVS